ncbi:MAG TPA: hypothetical protein VIK93_06545 [Limnochordales bacterium]
MDVRFAFLCDAAEQGPGGKISALGIGIDNFFVKDLSQPGPPFVFVCQLSGASTETGTKKVAIHLIDADGKEIAPTFTADLTINKPPVGNRWATSLVVQYAQIRYPHYGSYSISMVVDGHELVSLPFTVKPPPAAA